MTKDPKEEYNETMQELMLELKIKTDNLMKKFKKEYNTNRVSKI